MISNASFVRAAVIAGVFCLGLGAHAATIIDARPNVLFCIADDWGWPHAGAYGDPVVKTPTFDRMAREGVLFANAFVSSPSCTPSRSALMTGQYHWRLAEAANLHSTLQTRFRSYSEMLRDNGYAIGHSRKAWGPGKLEPGGRTEDPSGPQFKNFDAFLAQRPKGTPFCYWFGSPDPHRPYEPGTGVGRGMKLADVRVPSCFPDNELVRSDVADYYFEVERFDREVGEAISQLEATGELDNTIIVMTGDHGMPFPRGKSNLYDLGCHVPLVLRWGAKVKPGRVLEDFVSLTDLAPTFLEAAGVAPLAEMTGHSLLPTLLSDRAGWIEPRRHHVIYGKERHVPSQEKGNLGGYPSRAIRTADHLYIRNFAPERWPNGIADGEQSFIGNSYADCDDGPTKTFLIQHQSDPAVRKFFDLAFAKRPAEELYDLKNDPQQLVNVADQPAYHKLKTGLSGALMEELRASGDPRIVGGGEKFDAYPYYGATMATKKQKNKKATDPSS
ncbi:MAG: sulfatase [Planctomycetes bacterium]|nr:sulfatase [Planctomycetota bacterium]